MSRKLSRRRNTRDNGLAVVNPMRGDAITTGLVALGVGAGIGGGLGAIGGSMQQPPTPLDGAVAGASVGVGLTAFGGFVVGLLSPKRRDAAFATAGIGLGGLLVLNLAMNIASKSAPATSA